MQMSANTLTRRHFFAGMALAGAGFCLTEAVAQEAKKSQSSIAASTQSPKPARTSGEQRKPTSHTKKPAVTPDKVKALIQEKLARNPYYSPGFLISHRDVEPIFNFLLEQGITIAEDHEELYDSILPDNAPLVRLLKTPKGREFQKQLAGDAAAYHRLERLSWSGDGKKVLEGLLDAKDGLARLQKLKNAADVAKLSKQLAADSRTQDFALPTGHIHTADELFKSLEQVLARQKPAAE
jgi:hypothetical protein